MTGKALILVLGTAGVALAGGLGAAAIVQGGGAAPATDPALLARLDEIARSVESTRTSLDASRGELDALRDRVAQAESRLGVEQHAAPGGRRRIQLPADDGDATETSATTARRIRLDGTSEWSSDGRVIELSGESIDLNDALPQVEDAVRGALQGIVLDHGDDGLAATFIGDHALAGLGGLRKSFELRRLPEAERWQKARTDLGLNDTQVNELQAAVAERDQALKDALQLDRDETTGDTQLRVHRLDPSKAMEANAAYRRRVENTLNEDQRKSWRDDGFDSAFGNSSSGAAVISIATTTTETR